MYVPSEKVLNSLLLIYSLIKMEADQHSIFTNTLQCKNIISFFNCDDIVVIL